MYNVAIIINNLIGEKMVRTISIGVIILFIFFLVWKSGVFSSVDTTKSKAQVEKTLPEKVVRLEKRVDKIEKRLDRHADAISDLQEQINGLKDEPEATKDQKKKENKYSTKNWDYPDFPENW